mgnify:FL=1
MGQQPVQDHSPFTGWPSIFHEEFADSSTRTMTILDDQYPSYLDREPPRRNLHTMVKESHWKIHIQLLLW